MTIKEKIQYSNSKTFFTLFKEGLFYKCYNEDAMVFSQRVKNYKINAKFLKSVGVEVLSLGFPVSEVEKGNLNLLSISEALDVKFYKEEPHGIVFSLNNDIKQNYKEFQAAIIIANETDAEQEAGYYNENSQKLIKMIQEFDLANSTPMQGLVFIQELKNQVKTRD